MQQVRLRRLARLTVGSPGVRAYVCPGDVDGLDLLVGRGYSWILRRDKIDWVKPSADVATAIGELGALHALGFRVLGPTSCRPCVGERG